MKKKDGRVEKVLIFRVTTLTERIPGKTYLTKFLTEWFMESKWRNAKKE